MMHELQIISAWVGPLLSQYAVRLILGDIVLGAGVYIGYRCYTRLDE